MKHAKLIGTVLWFAFLITVWGMTGLLAGCKSQQPIGPKETEKITITEVKHDTVFITEADSSSYRALLDCLNGRVVIKEIIDATPGKYMPIPKVQLNPQQHGTALNVDCEAYARELLAEWKSNNVTKETLTEVPIYIERDYTWWETTLLYSGGLLWLLALIWLLRTIYNPFKTPKNG